MPAKLVPAIRTTYNQEDMIKGFAQAWFKAFNQIPKKESIGVLFAQNALETGGTKSMWNNNIGNYKFVPSKNPDDDNNKEYMMLSNVWEMIGGVKKIFNPPDPATWFKSFTTLAEGMAEYLDAIKNHRYKPAWAAVESGDPSQFAHLLKLNHYYTASEDDYIKGMQTWFNKFMKDPTFENAVAELQQPTTAPSVQVSNPTSEFFSTENVDKQSDDVVGYFDPYPNMCKQ